MAEERTHYHALGVSSKASAREVQDAWRSLSRALHPDKGGDAAAFAEVSVAYGILRDTKERKRYDAQLRLLWRPCMRCLGEGRIPKQHGFTRRLEPCPWCDGVGYTEKKGTR